MSHPGSTPWICAALSCAIALVSASVSAQPANLLPGFQGPNVGRSQHLVTLPSNSKPSKQSGLMLTAQRPIVPGDYGYRRIDVTVLAANPVAANVQITLKLELQGTGRQSQLTIEQNGSIDIGQSQTTISFRYPSLDNYHLMELSTWVDARPDDALSGFARFNSYGGTGSVAVLDATTSRVLRFPNFSRPGVQSVGNLAGLTLETQRQPLPENWLDLSPCDIVSTDVARLGALDRNEPAKLNALREWLAAGGTLWVGNVGADFELLGEVQNVLQLGDADEVTPRESSSFLTLGRDAWEYANLAAAAPQQQPGGGAAFGFEDSSGFTIRIPGGDRPISPQPSGPQPTEVKPVPSRGWFAVREVGFGQVYAFCNQWHQAGQQVPRRSQRVAGEIWRDRAWPIRHGLAPNSANVEFSNWLVPGVGIAPVMLFQVLITLFVIAIGPLNYWLLWRARRLHLLVVTVPCGALLLTVGLLVYGMLSDGLWSKVRARSVTILNQETGEAVSQGRLSYYASFAPSDGLRFDEQTAVYPIRPGYNDRYAFVGGNDRLDLQWTDQDQHLRRGWLRSRTPTQFFTQTISSTDDRIDFRSSGQSLSAVNNLGESIELLFVREPNGAIRRGDDIADGETVELASVDENEALADLRKLLMDEAPQFPNEMQAAQNGPNNNSSRRSQRRYMQYNGVYDYTAVGIGDNVMNQHIERLAAVGAAELGIAPGAYVALCRKSVAAPLGLEGVRENGSFHLVIGRWSEQP